LDPWTKDGATKILLNMAAGGLPEAHDVLNELGMGTFQSARPSADAAPGEHRHRHSMIESVPCPGCSLCAGTRVLKTAVRVAVIYRRRECSACGHRYSTHETIGARRYTINAAG
jgi:hypothetical protein